jgi:K+/H+ antiporter YhaU regulatory subunit KhtT
LKDGDDAQLMPNPHQPLPANARLIVIGMEESEERFLKLYQ